MLFGPLDVARVSYAECRASFREEVIRFAQRLGFTTVSAITILDRDGGDSEFINVENAPASYTDAYVDPSAYRRDPVMQHCKNRSVPIAWDRSTYVMNGAADLWEQMAGYGYCAGIATTVHSGNGRHFLLGVDRDQPLPKDQVERQRIMADLQLFTVYAQDAATRLFDKPNLVLNQGQPQKVVERSSGPSLTPRELEVLKWTMEGKTAWEVGSILGISERTALLHINNSMRKLDCTSKHQAVLKAFRLGIIR